MEDRHQSHYNSIVDVGEEDSECFSCPSIVDYRETETGDTEVTFSEKKYLKVTVRLTVCRSRNRAIFEVWIEPPYLKEGMDQEQKYRVMIL